MSLIQKSFVKFAFAKYIIMATVFLLPFVFGVLYSDTSYAACDTTKGEYAGTGATSQKGATDTTLCYVDTTINGQTKASPAPSNNKPATAANPSGQGGQSGQNNTAPPPDGTTCAIEKVGWLVCPASEFMGEIADTLYDKFIEELLVIEELNLDTTDNSLYEAWGLMRNIANIAFVIAFIFIIYSQVTGVGLSNYGIKKMLPRLVLVAILVNVSYWICALAVDASNIVGANLYGALKSLSDTPALNFNIVSDDDILVTGSNWASITVAILALGAVVMYMWPALILALISVLMAVFTVVVVLTLRQAIVIILIVISPLAFVAYLLPNTEALFKKWLAFLKTMLLMFPIIALVTGGSAFASAIVMKTSQSALIQIMGAAITVLPLFLTPVIMKAAGGVLNRVGGFVNNPNKGPVDRLRKGTEAMGKRAQDRAAARALQGKASNWDNIKSGGRYRRAAKKNAVIASDATRLANATRGYITGQTSNDAFANRLAGGNAYRDASVPELNRVRAGAQAAETKAHKEEIDNSKSLLENTTKGVITELSDKLGEAVKNGDVAGAKAAQELLMEAGQEGAREFVTKIQDLETSGIRGGAGGDKTMQQLQRHITTNQSSIKSSDADIYSWASDSGGAPSNISASTHADLSGLTDAQIATQSKGSLRNARNNGGISQARADKILANDAINGNIKGTQQEILADLLDTSR